METIEEELERLRQLWKQTTSQKQRKLIEIRAKLLKLGQKKGSQK